MSKDAVLRYRPCGAILQAYVRSQTAIQIIKGPLACVSGETEYLSPEGWRRIDQYDGGLVAQWDDGELQYVKPLEYAAGDCEWMWEFKNAHSLSMVMTENHRVPVYDWTGRLRVKTAGRLAERPSRHVVPTTFKTRYSLWLSELEIRLRVAIAADAHYHKVGKRCSFSLRKDRKKDRLRWLLDACNIDFTERVYEGRPTESIFSFDRPDFAKPLGAEWFSASSEELAILIDEVSHWDGLFTTDETRFFSNKKIEADVVQFAAHAIGLRASLKMREYPNNPTFKPTYNVYISTPGAEARVAIRAEVQRRKIPVSKQYCFSVPSTFFLARHDGCIFVTGNSGKTKGSAFKVFDWICRQKPDSNGVRKSLWYAIRNTQPDLLSTTIKDFKSVVPEAAGRFTMGHPPECVLKFGLKDKTRVDATVVFLAMDRPEDQRRIRGANATGVWMNELRELARPVYDQAAARADRFPMPGWSDCAHVIGDTNAWDEDHWLQDLYSQWEQGLMPDYEFFVQPGAVMRVDGQWQINTAAENLEVVGAPYYIRALQGKKDDWIKVNLANEAGTCSEGRPVHSDYSGMTHNSPVAFMPEKGRPVIVGMDFGLTPAGAFLQRDAFGAIHVFDEIVTGHPKGAITGVCGVKRFAELIKEKCAEYDGHTFSFMGDPAGSDRDRSETTYFQALAAEEIIAIPARVNDPTVRRGALEMPLRRLVNGKPGIVFHPRARIIREGLGGKWMYKRVAVAGADKFKDEPEKSVWSHVCEALEYGLMHSGENNLIMRANGRGQVAITTQPNWDPFKL